MEAGQAVNTLIHWNLEFQEKCQNHEEHHEAGEEAVGQRGRESEDLSPDQIHHQKYQTEDDVQEKPGAEISPGFCYVFADTCNNMCIPICRSCPVSKYI